MRLVDVLRRYAGLVAGIGILQAAQLIKAIANFAAFAVLLRYFGVDTYGVVSIGLAVYGVAMLIEIPVGQPLQVTIPTLRSAGRIRSVRNILIVAHLTRLSLIPIVAMVVIALSETISSLYGLADGGRLFLSGGFALMLRMLASPFDFGVLFAFKDYRSLSVQSLLESLGTVLAVAATVVWGFEPGQFIIAWAGKSILVYVFSWILFIGFLKSTRSTGWYWRRGEPLLWFRRLMTLSLPVMGISLAHRLSLYMGVLIGGFFFPPGIVGLYAFAANMCRQVWGTISYAETALLTYASEARRKGGEIYSRYIAKSWRGMVFIGVLASLGLLMFADEAILVVGGKGYLDARPLLQLQALMFLFMGLEVQRFVLYANGNALTVFKSYSVKVFIEGCAYALGIWLLGVEGLALATPVAYMVFGVILYHAAWRSYREDRGFTAERFRELSRVGLMTALFAVLGWLLGKWLSIAELGPLISIGIRTVAFVGIVSLFGLLMVREYTRSGH